jgi:hypothetical protein
LQLFIELGPLLLVVLSNTLFNWIAAVGKFEWNTVPTYIGSFKWIMLGALLVWLLSQDHFAATSDRRKASLF